MSVLTYVLLSWVWAIAQILHDFGGNPRGGHPVSTEFLALRAPLVWEPRSQRGLRVPNNSSVAGSHRPRSDRPHPPGNGDITRQGNLTCNE
jgi:hypothetical protein